MRVEGVEVETMLKNVRVKVLRETQERQLPFLSSSMVVNFVFNPVPGWHRPSGRGRRRW